MEVSFTLSGESVGDKTMRAPVDYARKTGIKIVPLCPFARSVFKKIRNSEMYSK